MRSVIEIIDRIKLVYNVEKDSQLLPVSGIKSNTLSTWKARGEVPLKNLDDISQNENISLDWLLNGKGTMLLSDEEALPVAQEHFLEEDENTVALNYYPDIVAAAGYGAVNEYDHTPQIMKFDKKFLEEFLNIRRFDRLDIIKVTGDSMEPYIHDGETVLIERHQEAKNGETVIANVNGHIYIKRFHTDPFGKWIKLISENESYGDISIEGKDLNFFSVVGIVRAKIKSF